MMCDFKVGEEVICINNEDRDPEGTQLKLGATYIVLGIFAQEARYTEDSIYHEGVFIQVTQYDVEHHGGWLHDRFRRPQVIEHFTEDRQKAPAG